LLIQDYSSEHLTARLRGEGIYLVTGAFTVHLRIDLPHLARELGTMYGAYRIEDPPGICDAHAHIARLGGVRGLLGPRVQAWADGERIFEPVPVVRAYTLLESLLNWAIATSDLAPMLVHSAVLERDGHALLLPAASGSGKSTLCAALVCRGWRLFSDEMAVFDLVSGELLPNPRPVSLKNRSIEVIRAFAPDAHLSPVYHGTPKGDIAYMRAPAQAVARANQSARPGLVIAPTYQAGANTTLAPLEKAQGFRLLTDNAVNYASLLRTGFDIMTDLVERSALYTLTYSDLDDAVERIGRLHAEVVAASESA